MMDTIFFLFVAAILLGAALYTAWKSARYTVDYPAQGDLFQSSAGALHYWQSENAASGDGLPIVFIHGASSNGRDAERAFEGKFGMRRMIYLDRPGHGHSKRRNRQFADPRLQADCVAELLAHLNIERAVIVGHSWGASVLAAFGLRHPECLAGAVFLAPATHPWPGGVLWYYHLASLPVIGALFSCTLALPFGERRVDCAIENVFAPDPVPKNYRQIVGAELVLRPANFRANAEDVAYLKGHVRDLSKDYTQISCPTLVISGTDDTVVWPHLHAHGLVRDLPRAKLIEIDGGGHMPHHSHNDLVLDAMTELLTSIDIFERDHAANPARASMFSDAGLTVASHKGNTQ